MQPPNATTQCNHQDDPKRTDLLLLIAWNYKYFLDSLKLDTIESVCW